MKRDIIIIDNKAVSVTGNDVWMAATEIAGLFHTTVPAVNAAIKAVRKSDVLNDYKVCRYMQLENGLYADVYALEIIIPVAFRLNTYNTTCSHMAGGKGTLTRETAGIRDVHTERKNWVLLIAHTPIRQETGSTTKGVARFLFHASVTPAACGSSLPVPRATPFPGKAPSLPKV